MNFLNSVLITVVLSTTATASTLTRLGETSYYISTSELSLIEAEFVCSQQGLELASFETEEEFLGFNDTMNEWGIDNTVSYWLGGLRLKSGLWYWTSTKSRLNYTNWGTNEPHCPTDTVCGMVLGNFDRSYYTEPRRWCAEGSTNEELYICKSKEAARY